MRRGESRTALSSGIVWWADVEPTSQSREQIWEVGAEIPRKQPSGLGLGLCGRTSSDVPGRPNEKPLQAFCQIWSLELDGGSCNLILRWWSEHRGLRKAQRQKGQAEDPGQWFPVWLSLRTTQHALKMQTSGPTYSIGFLGERPWNHHLKRLQVTFTWLLGK